MNITIIKTKREDKRTMSRMDLDKFVSLMPAALAQGTNTETDTRVMPALVLQRQKNGAPGMATFNGLVTLEIHGLTTPQRCHDVKRAAMEMPATIAAFTGSSGLEVVLLVSVKPERGEMPDTEVAAEQFYQLAYRRMARVYDAILPNKVTRMEPMLRHTFAQPLDSQPLYNAQAMPYPVNGALASGEDDDADEHLLALPDAMDGRATDMLAYQQYELSYRQAVEEVQALITADAADSAAWHQEFVTAMATRLCARNWPEEEAVLHLWRHMACRLVPGLTAQFVRTLVESVFAEDAARRRKPRPTGVPDEPLMQQIIRRMERRYTMRFNTVMGYPEYRPRHTWASPWRPVTTKVINTFTTDLQLAGVPVWNRDVVRYVESTRVPDFNPVQDFLMGLSDRWDGHDHIRRLAATVPTPYPAQWADWFHTWFLAMVAQWQGRDVRYGNSIVPLLVSGQGMHKSAFCRALLPPELRRWGYTDNLSMGEERAVHLAMAQILLINLDEFNRISPQKQQGFLKNIVQLPSVKVKRPYARHTEEVPRLASFIATTNMADVLTDPSGSRRFVGVEVTADIDMSQTPNYEQLYAQAVTELACKHRYWLDEEEQAAVMQHNRQFQQIDTSIQLFLDHFTPVEAHDPDVQWRSGTELMTALRRKAGSLFRPTSIICFGRMLRGIPVTTRRTRAGIQYAVKEKR